MKNRDMRLGGAFVVIVALILGVTGNTVAQESTEKGLAALAKERQDLPAWVREGKLPFSFQYGGQSSTTFLHQWKRTVQEVAQEGNKHKYQIGYRDDATQLEVVVDLTVFADFPAVDWVVRFKNSGSADSPILENVLALDEQMSLPEDVVLHCAQGSNANGALDASKQTGYDFQPYDKPVRPNDSHQFVSFIQGSWGNSSEQWLPFFNLQWKGGGMVWAVGWSGRWKMEVVRDAGNEVTLRAGQNTFCAKLQPGESVRTPRMAILFWKGDEAIAGHNQWRQLLIAHYLPRYDGKLQMPPVAATNFDATGNAGPALNEAHCLKWIELASKFGAEVFWLDACWFQPTPWGTNDHWGTWDPEPGRFPNGLKVVSDAAHAKGMKFLVWFIEHAVRENSYLLKTHPEWVSNGCWDYADPNAVKWLTDYIVSRLQNFGVDIYRHDGGLGVPTNHDSEDRQGISENHGMEGWYAYWDALRFSRPGGVPLDNCAGGGRNIDLETMMRSLPYWRSDANWRPKPGDVPASETYHQLQTAGLSLYVPLHGTGCWMTGGGDYRFRSMATAGVVVLDDLASPDFDFDLAKKSVEQVKAMRELWLGDFYPIGKIDVDETTWFGWQLHRSDLKRGAVTLFRRPKSTASAMDMQLRGLEPAKKYHVAFVDTKEERVMTGEELGRIRVDIPQSPGSVIVTYEEQP